MSKISRGISDMDHLITRVNEMTDMVDTIAANTEEISAQSDGIRGMADDLKESVASLSLDK